MKRWKKKLKSAAGETLAETLAAILVASLSSLILAHAAVSASRVNKAAEAADARFAEQQAAAEAQTVKLSEGTFTFAGEGLTGAYSVEYFGEADGLITFSPKGGEAP